MDKNENTFWDYVIGDYLALVEEVNEDKEEFKKGLKSICNKLGVDYKKYDVDNLL